MNAADRLADLLHENKIGCRLDYRGDPDCGGGRYMCHTEPAERLVAAGVTFAGMPGELAEILESTAETRHDFNDGNCIDAAAEASVIAAEWERLGHA